jgi:hypothetical protein
VSLAHDQRFLDSHLPYAPEREGVTEFERTLRPGSRITARWKLLEIRITAPALILKLEEDCVMVSYGSDDESLATRWLPLSNAPDWTPDHGVFPVLFQLSSHLGERPG